MAEMIRAAILSGAFPPGARLSVPEIARRFGVSRTPAREGLLMLEREGLVEPRASSGMAVIMGDAKGVLEMLDIREGLEAISTRRAAEHMTAAEITRLRALITRHEGVVRQGDVVRHVELDAEFHGMIRDGARNARLARELVRISQQLRVLNGALSRAAGWSGKAVIRDHRAIAAEIAARNPAGAEAAMRKHIDRIRGFQRITAKV